MLKPVTFADDLQAAYSAGTATAKSELDRILDRKALAATLDDRLADLQSAADAHAAAIAARKSLTARPDDRYSRERGLTVPLEQWDAAEIAVADAERAWNVARRRMEAASAAYTSHAPANAAKARSEAATALETHLSDLRSAALDLFAHVAAIDGLAAGAGLNKPVTRHTATHSVIRDDLARYVDDLDRQLARARAAQLGSADAASSAAAPTPKKAQPRKATLAI